MYNKIFHQSLGLEEAVCGKKPNPTRWNRKHNPLESDAISRAGDTHPFTALLQLKVGEEIQDLWVYDINIQNSWNKTL